MPYARRRYPRRRPRYTPRRRPVRRAPTRAAIYGSAARQLYRDVSKLKGLINVEFKYVDNASTINPGTTGTFVLLNGLATGDTASTRDGRQVRFKSIQHKMILNLNASASATTVRCIFLIDTQPNEAAPAAADVLQSVGLVAPRNLDYRKRFVILKDQNYRVNTDMPERTVSWYRNLDMKTVYDDGGDTIASITTNSLYMLMLSDEAANTPTVTYYTRLRFIDN